MMYLFSRIILFDGQSYAAFALVSLITVSDDLSSKSLYSYFIRTVPSGDVLATQYLKYVQRMGWHRIGIIYTSESFGLSVSNSIIRRAPDYDISITHSEVVFLPNGRADAFKETMGRLRSKGSFINFLLCTDIDLLRAMEEIQGQGMFSVPYVWFVLNDVAEDIRRYFSLPERPAASDFNGLIMSDVAYNFTGNPQYDNFYERWIHLDPTYYPGAGPGTVLSHGQARAYTCAWLLALGYQKDIGLARGRGVGEDQILKELISGHYPRGAGNLSLDLFSQISFDGPGGLTQIDGSGNPRGGSYLFLQLQNAKSVVVATSNIALNGTQTMDIHPGSHIWPGLQAGATPTDAPDWVNQNLTWDDPMLVVFATIACAIILASVVMIGVVLWRRRDPVIKASSPVFCVLELVGIIMTCLVIPLAASIHSDPICSVYPMVALGGITLLLSAIVVKNMRIYKIFNNIYCNKYAISNQDLLKQAAVLFAIFMLGPVLFVAIARPQLLYVVISNSKTAYICVDHNGENVSAGRSAYDAIMLIPVAILVAAASFLAYRTQHVPGNWSEAKAIAYAVYNLIVMRQQSKVQQRSILAMNAANTGDDDTPSLQGAFETQEPGPIMMTFRPMDPNVVSPRDDTSAMTFEQFENRLQERQSSILSADGFSNMRSSGRRSSPLCPRPTAAMNLALSQELRSSTITAGPQPIAVSPDLAVTESYDSSVEGETESRRRGRQQGSASSSSSQYELGLFSFGAKDNTQAVPALIQNRQCWLLRYAARWRTMKIVVVTSLRIVILTDIATGSTRTFHYINVQAISEVDHRYLCIECLENVDITFEFPNSLARDRWLRVFIVTDSNLLPTRTASSANTQDHQLLPGQRSEQNASRGSTADGRIQSISANSYKPSRSEPSNVTATVSNSPPGRDLPSTPVHEI
ncbi:Metabotropic glutamate receptor 8 [Mortierella sp. GBA30]|nr:Metabotropic glutamate receptor 8 [Mortierella sp. GBA30]